MFDRTVPMTSRRLSNILRKEWEVLFSDLNNTLFVTLVPFLIVGQALGVMWAVAEFGSQDALSNPVFRTALDKLGDALPAVKALPAVEQFRVLLLSQFNFYLLLIPTMIAVSFATFSIVEEKLSGSLEPLLATPVRTWELLLGKAISGAVPALLITWLCAAVFLVAATALGWGRLLDLVVNASWLVSLFLLTPAVAVLSFMLGVIGSSRARDPKTAQNLAVVIILPVLALVGVQVTGVVWFTAFLAFVLALGIALLDVLALKIAIDLFQRESIVVGWR